MFLPAVFLDTGQTDVPPVMFNGVKVTGGGTLSYFQTRAGCNVTCTATSKVSPNFYVNNGECHSATTPSKQFVVDRENHPNYTITFECAVVQSFRCVYNESSYSPEYTLEGKAGTFFPFLHCTFLIGVIRYNCDRLYSL